MGISDHDDLNLDTPKSLKTPGFTWNYEVWIGTYKIRSWGGEVEENTMLNIKDTIRNGAAEMTQWLQKVAEMKSQGKNVSVSRPQPRNASPSISCRDFACVRNPDYQDIEQPAPRAQLGRLESSSSQEILDLIRTELGGKAKRKSATEKQKERENNYKKLESNEISEQIITKHYCRAKNCANVGKPCYVEGAIHIPLTSDHVRRWVNYVVLEQATIPEPPFELRRPWVEGYQRSSS
ncbi:hypothetical protein V8E54_005762 [Elaphomyces granulatus]